jgi:two-component system sensor histidine kinase ChvG
LTPPNGAIAAAEAEARASDKVKAGRTKPDKAKPAATPAPPPARVRRRRKFLLSPLTRRILTVNMIALGVLFGGFLYLGEYRDSLIETELDALAVQGQIFAGALGEGAIGTRRDGTQVLLAEVARPLLRRLVKPTRTRARLFSATGDLVVDSRYLFGPGGGIQIEELGQGDPRRDLGHHLLDLYTRFVSQFPAPVAREPYLEIADQRAEHYPEAMRALAGDPTRAARTAVDGHTVLIATEPVQQFKQVLGAVMVTADGSDIEQSVYDVQVGILKVFAIALGVTIFLSFYLAGTIVRPIRRLAAAADRVTGGHGQMPNIPNFTWRQDEIGDLSEALREMTDALWKRMEAIETFAADVAHEIKNPLTSLRSAVETVGIVQDPAQRAKLLSIIQDDVKRMDRLISDISSASRLDAELARAQMTPVDVGSLLGTLIQVHEATGRADAPRLTLDLAKGASLTVNGLEGWLGQVFQNLITNAFSFSPPRSNVRMSARRDGVTVVVEVEDEGPGIPEENLDSIFERFYTQRPEGEAFGTHSGLGLSISRQIVEAHRGTITASNRPGKDGKSGGACFTVRLPAL